MLKTYLLAVTDCVRHGPIFAIATMSLDIILRNIEEVQEIESIIRYSSQYRPTYFISYNICIKFYY